MRLLLSCSILAAIGAVGCTRTSEARDGGSATDMSTAVSDMGSDAPSVSCTNDSQCNDHVDCTFDQCIVGNVCDHMAMSSLCNVAAGEHCDMTIGCTTMAGTCNVSADCDDHVYCNGTEKCVAHQCFHDADRNCDDGNPCTVDTCDEAMASCSYMTICDSGVVLTDAGPTCTTFTSPTDFDGTYSLVPAQSQACGGAGGTYNVSQVTLTVSGTTITATTGTSGAISMSGTFTGSSFDVMGTVGTNTYHLTGSFACRERFMGHWTAVVHGFGCTNQDVDVRGGRM